LQLNGSAMRVLIVDDSAGLREIMRIGLQARGYEVAQAADGREALKLQRERPADVIVTDLFMPEMDGIETLEVVKHEFPDTPVVAMSGVPTRTGTDFLEIAHELGAALVLRKPFTIPDLVAAVEQAAGKH
jgi:CheY-like chemotaxis protein